MPCIQKKKKRLDLLLPPRDKLLLPIAINRTLVPLQNQLRDTIDVTMEGRDSKGPSHLLQKRQNLRSEPRSPARPAS